MDLDYVSLLRNWFDVIVATVLAMYGKARKFSIAQKITEIQKPNL